MAAKYQYFDCTTVRVQPMTDEEHPWKFDLYLQKKDRKLIEEGYWLNDKVINAAMILLKNQYPDIGGLTDTITLAFGHESLGSQSRFVQIICLRDNHWVTISNVNALPFEVFVYDSMLRLSEKDNRLRVSYPPELAEIACKLRRPTGNLFFTVHEVQQQAEGFDCGLFAIANAAAVCEGIEPGTVTYNQKLMRPALIHSIQTDDISSFVKTISKSVPTGNPQQPLYQWEVKVYCTCRLPPDGRPMVECTECKQWFHEHCVSGDIVGQTWTCTACTDKLKSEEDRKVADLVDILKLREMATQDNHTTEIQELYDAINTTHEETLPECHNHIGCLKVDEYRKEFSDNKKMRGVTYHVPRHNEFFIVIFFEEHSTPEDLLKTVVHEIVHAVSHLKGYTGPAHGSQFKRMMKSILKCVQAKQAGLPEPYCRVKIDTKTF